MRELFEQRLVLSRKGRALVAVYVELADDPAVLTDEDHQLRAGAQGAGQVVVDLAHVLDDLVSVLGHRGTADAFAHLDARVLRRRIRAGERPHHEGPVDKQVDTAPVPERMLVVDDPHDLVEHLLVRRIRGREGLYLGLEPRRKTLIVGSLFSHRKSPCGASPAMITPARRYAR